MLVAMEEDMMEMGRLSGIELIQLASCEQGPEEWSFLPWSHPWSCKFSEEDYLKGKERLLPHRADLGERYNTDFQHFRDQLMRNARFYAQLSYPLLRVMKDPSFYIENDNELEAAHAGRDAIFKDDLDKIITSGTHGYRNDFAFMDQLISLYGTHSYRNGFTSMDQLISLYSESYMYPFYNSGNGNELKVARAGRDSILKDDLAMEQYKEALGHITGIAPATFTNKRSYNRVGTLAAIDSWSIDGAPMARIHLVLDSGASSHVVGDKGFLKGYQRLANPRMGIQPDKSMVSMIGVGTIQTEHFSIPNVFHVEGLGMNLISTGQLDQNYGMCSWFARGQCGVMLPDGTTAGEGTLENGVYVLSKLHVPAGPVMEA